MNHESLIDDVISINNDKERYQNYLRQPIFIDNKIPNFCKPENVLNFLREIIEK